jgi:hypothetical protein
MDFELKHILKKSEIGWKGIIIHTEERHLFPPPGIPFFLMMDDGRGLQVKLDTYYRIRLTQFFNCQNLKPGDEITFRFRVKEIGNQGYQENQLLVPAQKPRKFSRSKKYPKNFLELVEKEKKEIDNFIGNRIKVLPSNEKLCFWVWFCYNFQLYSEGAMIFRKINKESIPSELYKTIEKLGKTCENKALD